MKTSTFIVIFLLGLFSPSLTKVRTDYKKSFNAVDVPEGFSYNSKNNLEWESIDKLRRLVKEHVDPDFKI